MSIEQMVIEKLRALSPEQKKEVLEFVESLEGEQASNQPRQSLYGLWADLGIDLSEEDLAEARREMWAGFPREPV